MKTTLGKMKVKTERWILIAKHFENSNATSKNRTTFKKRLIQTFGIKATPFCAHDFRHYILHPFRVSVIGLFPLQQILVLDHDTDAVRLCKDEGSKVDISQLYVIWHHYHLSILNISHVWSKFFQVMKKRNIDRIDGYDG